LHRFLLRSGITRNSAAYDHIRRFHITASADGVTTISTPVPREIYVEHLISQNRNDVSAIEYKLASDPSFTNVPEGSTMFLAVGNTYDIKLYGSTATQGYNQLESFISLPNTLFRVNHVTSTYTAPPATSPNTSDTLYADACGWDNDPYSPSYRSCIVSDDKRGGDVTNTFNVTIISGSGTNQPLSAMLFDFSGSSYHYNADFSSSTLFVSIINAVNITKSFRNVSGTYYLDFTLVNPTSSAVSGLSFTDPLPSSPGQMTVTETTSTTSNCGSATLTATAGATSISFEKRQHQCWRNLHVQRQGYPTHQRSLH
jgi:hypothetical protein